MVSASTFIILSGPIKLYEGVELASAHFTGGEMEGSPCRELVGGRETS